MHTALVSLFKDRDAVLVLFLFLIIYIWDSPQAYFLRSVGSAPLLCFVLFLLGPIVPNLTSLDSTHRSFFPLEGSSCKEDLDS